MKKVDNQIFKLRVQALYSSWIQVATAVVVLGSLVAFSMDTYDVWIWFGGYLAIGGYFLGMTYLFSKQINDSVDAKQLKMFFEHWQIQSIFFASMWAALIILTIGYTAEQRLIIGFVAAGVVAGTAISSATFPNISKIYSAIVLGSLILCYAYFKIDGYIAIGVMSALYWGLVVRIQQTVFQFFQKNFELMIDLESTQDKLRHTQEMVIQSSRLATQTEMMANLAHEINNPLAILFLHFHRAKQKSLKKEFKRADLDSLLDRSLGLAQRIQDTISTSKKLIYTNLEEQEPEPIELSTVVREVLYFFKPRCQKNQIEFVYPEKIDTIAWCTEAGLIQILSNLLNNAFSEIKGQKNARIELKVLSSDTCVLIQIIDSGKGVESSDREKIFQSFFTNKEKGQGLGMGLPISRKIAEKFGGSLEIEDQQPTTFTLKLRKDSGTKVSIQSAS